MHLIGTAKRLKRSSSIVQVALQTIYVIVEEN